jgi:hypothetical protein
MLEAQTEKLQGDSDTADIRRIEHSDELHGYSFSVTANETGDRGSGEAPPAGVRVDRIEGTSPTRSG